YPSASSWSYARSTVLRDTARSRASVRLDGSRAPAASSPARIARRSPAYTWPDRASSSRRVTSMSRLVPHIVDEAALLVEPISSYLCRRGGRAMIFHDMYTDVPRPEIDRFIGTQEMGRLVTVGADGMPHIGL